METKSAMKEDLDSLVRLYVTLLEVSEAIASHRDLEALMHDLAPRLHGLVEFDGLALPVRYSALCPLMVWVLCAPFMVCTRNPSAPCSHTSAST
jgi:hypothetical protein